MLHFRADVRDLVNRNADSLGLLLVLSGFFGAVYGAISATWQGSIETSQFLIGTVRYDPGTPIYNYHVSVISLINHVGAFFLLITGSEAAASMLLAIALGVLAMQTVGMLVFLAARNVYLAVLAALVVNQFHLYGSGIAYPIFLFGSPHAFGRAGLTFVVMAALLFAFSRWRAAFFFSGLSLAIHPSWGIWLNGCLFVAIAFRYRELKPLLQRATLIPYAAGVAIALLVAIGQRIVFPVVESAGQLDPGSTHEMFLNYIRYWDYHRGRFAHPLMLTREFAQVVLATGMSVALLRSSWSDIGIRLFATFLLVSTALGVFFVFVPAWFDPSFFPELLVVLMPGRFINISILVAFPLLLGFVLRGRADVRSLTVLAAVWAAMTMIVWNVPMKLPLGDFQLSLLLTAGGVLAWGFLAKPQVRNSWKVPDTNILLFATLIGIVAFTPAYVARHVPVIRQNFSRVDFPSEFRGTVLTTMERYFFQIEGRVATVTPNTDGYVYSSDSFEAVNRFYIDMYGVSLGAPPPSTIRRNGGFGTWAYAGLWGSRDCAEWGRLSERYGFGAILVPSTLSLKLRKVNRDPLWNVYYPRCEGS